MKLHHHARLFGILLVVTLFYSQAVLAKGATTNLVKRTLAEVVTVRVFDDQGLEIGFGSGFFIGNGELVTNAHVVAGGARAEILDTAGTILGSVHYAVMLDLERDLAVLTIPSRRSPGLELAGSDPETGDDILVFGAPMGLEGTVSSGIVSALRTVTDIRRLQFTAPISTGSSGGPVVNRTGEVVGVVASTLVEGQNLNFAIAVSELRDLLGGQRDSYPFPTDLDLLGDSSDVELMAILHFLYLAYSAETIQVGEVRHGWLGAYRTAQFGLADFYHFEGQAGSTIDIYVHSVEFDAMVDLINFETMGDDDPWWYSDDDSGVGGDAKLSARLPKDGAYTIVVHAYDDIEGDYKLTLRYREDSSGPDVINDRWVLFSSTEDAMIYFDSETLIQTYEGKTVWVRWAYEAPKKGSDGEVFNTATMLYMLDCRNRRLKLQSIRLMNNSAVISSSEIPSFRQQWQSIAPDTIGEEIFRKLCN